MAVLDWVKKQTENLQTEIGKFRNKEMMEAVVAGCAIVAYADGFVSAEEKQKMIGFMQQSESLKVFDTTKVIELFGKYVTKFEFDNQIGKGEALSAIVKLKNKPAEAQLLVRVCISIAGSDGNFEQAEKEAVIMICHELGLNPKNFDL